ncbi:MAG: ribosomal protein S18-alanine N-acetyltransferase [Acetatifactor sp.]
MQITVRELREEDIEELSRIEAESFSLPWSAQDFRDLLKHSYCFYLVAETEGKVVGCCGFTDSCHEGNIDNVVVDAAYRGKGVAQTMLRELIVRGEAQGIEAFSLEVRVSNEAAIHIYEKLGFRSAGIRPGFYEKPVEDAMIMWRYPSDMPPG